MENKILNRNRCNQSWKRMSKLPKEAQIIPWGRDATETREKENYDKTSN